MQNQIFQSSAKCIHSKKYLSIHLVETFALILHSNIVFKKLFWLKLSILKITLHGLNPLIPGGNKRSHILKQAYSF